MSTSVDPEQLTKTISRTKTESRLALSSANQSLGTVRMGSGASSVMERGHWDHKAEFLLSCIGFSVGLGNVWRFPYLAFQHGGAAFLFAYLILQVLVGKPMYFMELVMGQFSGKGPSRVWDMLPTSKGIGVSMCLISFTVAIYYNIIISYTIYYFFSCFLPVLPWTKCLEEWQAEDNCMDKKTFVLDICTAESKSNCTCTGKEGIDNMLNFQCTKPSKTAAELFFYKTVIQKSEGIELDQVGAPLWWLVICLAMGWFVVYICLVNGIKSSGKVVYFTATFPYVILFVMLIRGATLEGAGEGIKFFFFPKWSKLQDFKVWIAALGQMFFSLSVSMGGIIMFGSYNKFDNKVYNDAILISMLDTITSVIAGFVVFTCFGNLAYKLGTTVDKVATAGYGLAFIVYPEAMVNIQPTRLWTLLFFFMLFLLGLDSAFALVETFLTSLQDEFPKMRRYKKQLCSVACIVAFLLGLPATTPAGDYIVTLMDFFGGDFCLIVVAFFEVSSVGWIYGSSRFVKDIEYMLGGRPHGWRYWLFCWSVSAPLVIGGLLVFRFVNFTNLKYANGDPYPIHALVAGYTLLFTILIPIPFFFFRRVYLSTFVSKGERFAFLFKPTDHWIPNDNYAHQLQNSTYHAKRNDEEKSGNFEESQEAEDQKKEIKKCVSEDQKKEIKKCVSCVSEDQKKEIEKCASEDQKKEIEKCVCEE